MQPQNSNLQIISEEILVDIPRRTDGQECLRVRATKARTPDGKDVGWTDIREFWKGDDGVWRPSRKGITVRARELSAVAEALSKAAKNTPSAT
jgi:hypothetical protein